MVIHNYSMCSCGAVTLYTDLGIYYVQRKNLKKFFPGLDLRALKGVRLQNTFCCDHCVNHYGLDLCGCGSGEPFGECENGMEECSMPMQVLGAYTKIRAKDAI